MLDTAHLKLNYSTVNGANFLEEIPPYLDPERVTLHTSRRGDRITGRVGTLTVSITRDAVTVSNGSLCKWMMGDNYQLMTRRDIQMAVERLGDILHLPMDAATVTRLDVGASIVVEEPPANYFNHFGTLAYAARLPHPHGLYYSLHQCGEVLCFYDKNKEQRDHRAPIPEQYRGVNVLRYEQRYTKQLPRLLNRAQITAATLYESTFLSSLAKQWEEAYQRINKINAIRMNPQFITGKKDLNRAGVLALIQYYGGEMAMMEQIKEAQRRGEYTAEQARGLRSAIKAACRAKEGFAIPVEAISEFDRKVAEIVGLYK